MGNPVEWRWKRKWCHPVLTGKPRSLHGEHQEEGKEDTHLYLSLHTCTHMHTEYCF